MGDLHEPDIQLATSPAQPGTADRRRPGRPRSISPALLPLLRAPHGATDALDSAARVDVDDATVVEALLLIGDSEDTGSRPFRGIAVCLLLALPFWAAVLYFVLR